MLFRSQLLVAGNEVGVQMRLNDVLDDETVGSGFFDVLLDVALRIDNGRFPIRSDKVGGVREATQIKLSEMHARYLVLARDFEHPVQCNARIGRDFPGH